MRHLQYQLTVRGPHFKDDAEIRAVVGPTDIAKLKPVDQSTDSLRTGRAGAIGRRLFFRNGLRSIGSGKRKWSFRSRCGSSHTGTSVSRGCRIRGFVSTTKLKRNHCRHGGNQQ